MDKTRNRSFDAFARTLLAWWEDIVLNPMTLDRFKELMKEYRAELQDNDCGTWSKDAREWAIANGLIGGTGNNANGEPNYAWADQLTREQAAALFYRFAKLMGKA